MLKTSKILYAPDVGGGADRTNNLSYVRSVSENGRWDEYSRERDLNIDVIQAIDFTLNQTAAGGGVDLYIVCDILTIDGPINLPGKNITLVAREVVGQNNASIDTSGVGGTPDPKRARDGGTPGAKGADGATGQNGSPGGAVLIAAGRIQGQLGVRSNGGAGAKGQQGGQGAVGPTGPTGSAATRQNGPGNGGQGGAGGKGGKAGNGGNGGDAGQITVLTSEQPPPTLKIEAIGGTGGQVGNPGNWGEGGYGGAAGDNHIFIPPRPGPDGGSPGGDSWYPPARPGPRGPHGPAADPNLSVSSSGGSPKPTIKIATDDDIATYIPITQLTMGLSHSFLLFANRDFAHLLERLVWVRRMALSAQSGTTFYDKRATRAGSASVGRPTRSELDTLGAQASILIDRARQGLDVFGHAANYVSSLTADYLVKAAARRFEIAAALESAHNTYLDKLSDLTEAGVHLKISSPLLTSRAISFREIKQSLIYRQTPPRTRYKH